jgi:hypothetical protein
MSRLLCVLLLVGCGGEGTVVTGGDAASQSDGPPPADEPFAVAGADREVLGGLVVPLDGTGSLGSVQWTGDVTIDEATGAVAYAHIPDVAAGTVFTFTITSTVGGEDASDTMTVTVMDAVFDDFLEPITDPAELNASEGIEFASDALWVVSNQTSFVSRFDTDGAFVQKHTIAGRPVGMNMYTDGRLLLANVDLQEAQLLDPVSGEVTTLFDQLEGGGAVGNANYPLPAAGGDVYLSTRTSLTIVRYDASDGVAREWLDLTGIAVNPNALAFGPEPDRLYVGTSDAVYRVPIQGDGSAGTPERYVDAPSEVDGLVFDEGRNLWVGCPNSSDLVVAPYAASGATTASRTFSDVGGNISLFVNTTFGSVPFGDTTLYWTNLGDRSVGRLPVGLRALDPPLAP